MLSGKDLIGIAQTGTGKTLAFLMPAFIHTDLQVVSRCISPHRIPIFQSASSPLQPLPRKKRGGPNVLVLSPTRELALQIDSEVKKYEYKGIKSVCLYGGGNRREQKKIVTAGVQVGIKSDIEL